MFNKDILLIDLEFTGLDPKRHDIIQIAAVLLDKRTLKEKKFFNAYIKPSHWAKRDPESMAINGIEWETLKYAPSLRTVINAFNKKFSKNIMLAYYGGSLDIEFLKAAYTQIGKKFEFNYHYINLWVIFYTYLVVKNKFATAKGPKKFSLKNLAKYFKIPALDLHDALSDCRVEAEILRTVIKEMKKR